MLISFESFFSLSYKITYWFTTSVSESNNLTKYASLSLSHKNTSLCENSSRSTRNISTEDQRNWYKKKRSKVITFEVILTFFLVFFLISRVVAWEGKKTLLFPFVLCTYFFHFCLLEEVCMALFIPIFSLFYNKIRFQAENVNIWVFQGRKIRNPPAGYPPDIRNFPDF